ncbi:Ig-like domain-containing protein [Flavobacterium sp. '19STA2R22 D10 B1']|uniref:Ig-like domain-containing protein n=1 Tax=Flavobacterium aerium TaxID=3037261 RepID=UPI00278C6B7B|nr:Ig-like domain-containing protein [Flavobacterium sp. '19STA2R22 D10 B1']
MKKLFILFVFGMLSYLGNAMPIDSFIGRTETIIERNAIEKETVLSLGAIRDIFPDLAMAEEIRLALIQHGITKPNIDAAVTQAELDQIITISAIEKDIKNIDGLEYCSTLSKLFLDKNQISNLAPLRNLPLTYLILDYNEIKDISGLSLLTQLIHLSVRNNKISDANVVSNFPVLEVFLGSGNLLKTLPHFISTNLNTLYFNRNQIRDLSPANLWNVSVRAGTDFSNQEIHLPSKYNISGAVMTNNPLIGINGSILNDINTISDAGVYTSPTINWTNLSASSVQTSFDFEVKFINGYFSGTVVQPLSGVEEERICIGETLSLTANSTVVNPIYTWYSDPELTTQIATGASYTVSPTVTTVYYVSVQGDDICENESGTAKAIQVIVNPKAVATDITVDDTTICIGETATLSATSTIANPVFTWYSDATLTTVIHTGATYGANPTVTTTYYITVSGDGVCENEVGTAKEIVVTVNPKAVATDITVGEATICIDETAMLTATSTLTNPIFTWYRDATLTTVIHSGATYEANPTVTTTYYITVRGDGICENAAGTAKTIVVTVNPKAVEGTINVTATKL